MQFFDDVDEIIVAHGYECCDEECHPGASSPWGSND